MSEEWRPIEGGVYSVSDLGRVRREAKSPGTRPGKVLSSRSYNGFYPSVAIHLPGVGFVYRRLVHDMVAEAFLGPRPEGMEVNHLDGIKGNNRVENLEYVTPSQNAKHAHLTGLSRVPGPKPGSANHAAKLTEADVPMIRQRVRNGETYLSVAGDFRVSESLIGLVVKGKAWRHVL